MKKITDKAVKEFGAHLVEEEKSRATLEKYVRDVSAFSRWLGKRELCKAIVLEYKELLIEKFAPASVNSALSSLNSFFEYIGEYGLKVKSLKIQKRIFADRERELTKAEYNRLLKAAKDKGNERLFLLMQTICASGLRVSEIKFITIEAVKARCAEIKCKGKIREVFLPDSLCRELLKYAKKKGIKSGMIFVITNKKEFAEKVRAASLSQHNQSVKEQKKQLAKCEKRYSELDELIKKLYESYATGKLTEKRFELLSAGYEQEQESLANEISELQESLETYEEETDNVNQFIELAKKYTDFTVLTTPMINEFIDKIVVHAPYWDEVDRFQQIDIYFNFIGQFELPKVEPTPEELAEMEKLRKRRLRNKLYTRRYREKKKAEKLAAQKALEEQQAKEQEEQKQADEKSA